MDGERGFLRNVGPVILRLDQQASWSRINAPQFRRFALALLALSAAVVSITWGRVQVLANGYEITDLRGRRDELLSENQMLHRRIADEQSLDHVEVEARGRLGMVDINPNRVISLGSESRARRLANSVEALFGARASRHTFGRP